MNECTVVVCTHNRPSELEQCLVAISRQTCTPAEVLVIDSASSNPASPNISERSGSRYIFETFPGLSRARNRGLQETKTSLIVYVDDDAIPTRRWLENISSEFSDASVGVVAGKIDPLHLETEAEILFQKSGGFQPAYQEKRKFDRNSQNWFELANFGGIGTGANIAFRTDALKAINGFDERLGQGALLPGYEDYNAIFKILSLGWKAVYTPLALVHHPYPNTIQALRSRYLKGIKASGAYAALLLTEANGFRSDAMRCIFKSFGQGWRAWSSSAEQLSVISRCRMWMERLSGVFLYYTHLFLRRHVITK
jgi:GT2 family glycosyltransferase